LITGHLVVRRVEVDLRLRIAGKSTVTPPDLDMALGDQVLAIDDVEHIGPPSNQRLAGGIGPDVE
jgi:hypothetical protein